MLFGAFLEGFFFVFDDDFVIGDFDDFVSGDGEFGVNDGFDRGAFDDDLLDGEVVGSDGKILDFA